MSVDARAHAFLRLADENKALAHRLFREDDPPLRWVATVGFYSSIHYIGAYLWAHEGREISDHAQRNIEIHHDPMLRRIVPNYRTLFIHSIRARYRAYYKATPDQVAELLNRDLALLESSVRANLPPS